MKQNATGREIENETEKIRKSERKITQKETRRVLRQERRRKGNVIDENCNRHAEAEMEIVQREAEKVKKLRHWKGNKIDIMRKKK